MLTPQNNLRDRVVAVTGAGGALGSALAVHLVSKGYRAALFDTERSKDRIAQLADKLGPKNAFPYAGDFGLEATWSGALAATKAEFGSLPTHGALVAGGWDGGTPLHEAKDDAGYAKMMAANVDTAYRGLRALLPPMVAGRYGSIVVVGSRAAVQPWTSAGSAAYAASKAAVLAMAQTVAQEVLAHGVRVNAILPSTMDTPANRASMPNADTTKWVSLKSAASVIAFLLSEDARDVSGATLPVYGRS